MPARTAPAGQKYKVDGKTFIWTTEDGAEIRIPMRVKLGVIRKMSGRDLDAAAMFDIIEAIAPGQGDVLDDTDVNDFSACFQAWQTEYQALSGATPGE